MLTRSDLHEYQSRAVDFIKSRKRCMLLLQMGLGKSVSTLTAASDLLDGCAVERVLVIAPLRVANSVWAQECDKWSHLNHLKVSVCTGSERKRISALQRTADVYTINRENVPWLVKHCGKHWPFDAVVVDESSSFKSNSAQRWKALKRILPDTEYMVLLTGTPSPNSLLDLWAQMYLVDFGERLGRTMTGFKQRFFEQDYMGYRWTIKDGAADTIHSLVSDVCLSMSAEDYLQLPERIDLVEHVQLPPKVQAAYATFEKDLLGTLPDGEEVEAINAAVLANKLLQWCIAEGTPVVTARGLVPIESVSRDDLIWDGESFVNCDGSVYKGNKHVVNCYGVRMTEEHKVLTTKGWKTAKEVLDGESTERFDRERLRSPNRFTKDGLKVRKSDLVMPMHMRKKSGAAKPESPFETQVEGREILRMSPWEVEHLSRNDAYKGILDLEKHDFSMQQSKRQGLQKLRGSWDKCLQGLGKIIRSFLGGYANWVFRTFDIRSNGQFFGLLKGKLSLGNTKTTGSKYSEKQNYMDTERGNVCCGGCGNVRSKCCDATCEGFQVQMAERKMVPCAKVYDLINCGKNNRFTVVGDDGGLLIVHNCNGATYTDDQGNWSEVHSAKLDALQELVEANDEPMLVAYNYKTDLMRLKQRFPHAVALGKDQQVMDDWNAGKIPMLLAHPASSAHGLNLQHGGSLCVWFGLNWSLELYQQFNARLHRQGQTKPVRIVHIVAEGCIDERVLEVLSDKDATQRDLLRALK